MVFYKAEAPRSFSPDRRIQLYKHPLPASAGWEAGREGRFEWVLTFGFLTQEAWAKQTRLNKQGLTLDGRH